MMPRSYFSKQSVLFPDDSILSYKEVGTPLINVSNITNKGKTNHMPKFKEFHKFQKPLVGLSTESF